MKVKFCCDNGANIHSEKTETFDTEKDLGYTDEEWLKLGEDGKHELVKEWAMQSFEYWIEENEE